MLYNTFYRNKTLRKDSIAVVWVNYKKNLYDTNLHAGVDGQIEVSLLQPKRRENGRIFCHDIPGFLMGLRCRSDKLSSLPVTFVLCHVFSWCSRGDQEDIPIARPARFSITSHVTPVSHITPLVFICPLCSPGQSLYVVMTCSMRRAEMWIIW